MTEEMGEENIFIFGMKVDEVEALRKKGFEYLQFFMHFYCENILWPETAHQDGGGGLIDSLGVEDLKHWA